MWAIRMARQDAASVHRRSHGNITPDGIGTVLVGETEGATDELRGIMETFLLTAKTPPCLGDIN